MGYYADRERYRRSGRGEYSGNRYGYGGGGYSPRFENDYEGQYDDPSFERAEDWRSPGYGDRGFYERGLGSNAGYYDNPRRYGSGGYGRYRGRRDMSTSYPDDFGGYGRDFPENRRYGSDYPESRRYSSDYGTTGRNKWDYGYPEIQTGTYYGRGGGYPQSDRGWWDKASDEVASWFGDEEAERRRRMDDVRGDYRGRGPRGYMRSDDRIEEDVNDRLTDHPYVDASNVEVEVSNGEVVLSGTVESRRTKRLAEEICENVSGVKNVENRIRVDRSTSTYGSTTDRPSITGESTTTTSTGRAATTKP